MRSPTASSNDYGNDHDNIYDYDYRYPRLRFGLVDSHSNDSSYGNGHGDGMFGWVGTTAKTRFLTPTDDCSSSHVPEGVRNDSYDNNNGYGHNHGNGNRCPR